MRSLVLTFLRLAQTREWHDLFWADLQHLLNPIRFCALISSLKCPPHKHSNAILHFP